MWIVRILFASNFVSINQIIIFVSYCRLSFLLHTFLLFYLYACVSECRYIFLFAFLSVGLIYRERNKNRGLILPKLGKYIVILNGFPDKSCQATFYLSKP